MRSAISEINQQPAFWKRCIDVAGKEHGYLLYVHQPRIATLHALDRWILEFKGCISRFDIALELIPADATLLIVDLVGWLSRNSILKWRPPGHSFDIGLGFYSVLQMARHDGRKSSRDYVIYPSLSKICPGSGQERCRFELRFQRSQAVKRERQAEKEKVMPSSLLALNPHQIFSKHIKFVDMDGYDLEHYISKIVRRTLEHLRTRHQHSSSDLIDRHRATRARRIKALMHRLLDGKAQSFKDQCPMAAKRLKRLRKALLIPSSLTWPDQKAAHIDIAK